MLLLLQFEPEENVTPKVWVVEMVAWDMNTQTGISPGEMGSLRITGKVRDQQQFDSLSEAMKALENPTT